jgi:MFS family permease
LSGRRKSLAGRLRDHLERPEISAVALAGYRHERIRDLCFPVASALMEGGFVGVLADKIYHVHPSVLALISAAPMLGNLSSFLWARLAHGRPKVPILVRLQLFFMTFVALVAFLPPGPVGATVLTVSLVMARLVLGGIVTLRSLVWTLNYPRDTRARVTARLHFFAIGTLTATSFLGSAFLDRSAESFRVLYAVGALIGAVGVVSFSRIRLLDEDAQLALERGMRGAGSQASLGSLFRAFGILRRDRLFARYQLCQFVLGLGNLMVSAPLVYLVSRELQAGYVASIGVVMVIPLLFSMLTLPIWGGYMDRVHVSEFRARHSWLWVLAHLLTFVGALRGSLGWLIAGAMVFGAGRGGGALAWNLGHNDFARGGEVADYMGLHVTLTGIRGAFAPFLGMAIYLGWPARDDLGLPALAGLGAATFLLSGGLCLAATLGFVGLHRRIERERAGRSGDPGGG